MAKIFRVYAANGRDRYAELDLPAGDYEMLDLMERLRLKPGQLPYLELLECREEHGYLEIAAQYRQGMDSTIQGIYEWMGDNLEAVWQFCLDVLEAHRLDWPEPEERDTDV